ncbi:Methionine--tRNA ligase, cytoplasmic [Chionoecetes opilio]|uniref:Methionine--tRNA ligase, cytoplasmic n=1 Tax=Chionoecetes opilio TaxID=41210 RepID=A0A8J5CUV6_CHIOP|nr:Methionine--tRNA ligase, cytoplasmic [Chionoecetes opilio]
MRLISIKEHPNGLKILVASVLSGQKVEVALKPGVLDGAVLEASEAGVTYRLQSNSAVLHLLRETEEKQESSRGGKDSGAWLEWDAYHLQPVLAPYLVSVTGGREDKDLRAALQSLLATLATTHPLNAKEVNAASVVLFCSLVPLLSETVTTNLLQEQPSLLTYLTTLRETPPFDECVAKWWPGGSSSLKSWVGQAAPPPSPSHSTLALLKGCPSDAPSRPAPTNPADQAKPVRATVSPESVKEAEKWWHHPSEACPAPKAQNILPVKGESNILVTSALPYVNNVPHLGNIIGCVLSSDCFVRFCRLRGDNVLFVSGTDEYGTATETKAIAEGLTPKQICDKYHVLHSEIYQWFNISFDNFGRTTTQKQTDITQDIFFQLDKNGHISQESVEQLFCGKCERFLADRFVEGSCPHPGCGYEDARGDQCDGCGKLVNAMDLIRPRCKLCSSTPEVRSSNHLFLDLPSIEPKLKTWLTTSSPQWTANAQVICDSWVKDGLKKRCITRDLKWGTPVPKDNFREKVFYVWFDAPIGYISMTACYTDQWRQWWHNPDQVQYYQFMAKDNVPFHSVVFPSTLLGTDEKWTQVTHLIATEYLNYEDSKFSKSRGVGVFGDQAMSSGILSDVWRFYLLYLRPEGQDTSFSWVDLQTKNNSELLNNLGNFIHRSLSFVFKFFGGAIPAACPAGQDFEVMAAINKEVKQYTTTMATNRQREGLRAVLSITRIGNQYIQEQEPYRLVKPDRPPEDRERGATVTAVAANIVALVAVLLEPYMPETAGRIRDLLGNPTQLGRLPQAFTQFLPVGHVIKEPQPLITQLDCELIEKMSKKFGGETKSSKKEINPAEVTRLQALVEAQGSKVRQLKGGGMASKAEVAAEVATLINLKSQLANAQGVEASPAGDKDKKKNKKSGGGAKENIKPPPATQPSSNTPVNEAEVSRLQALVTQQGEKVRALKTSGASKEAVAPEVAVLLDLKQQLAAAQGINLTALTGKDKKKKK